MDSLSVWADTQFMKIFKNLPHNILIPSNYTINSVRYVKVNNAAHYFLFSNVNNRTFLI